MNIKVSYNDEFDALMEELKNKYPAKLFDLDGIGEQLDLNKFSKNFFSVKTTADVSIDANANVDDISVIAYNNELPKPFFKLNSYYMLWKELKRLYSIETANDIIEKQLSGDIYINDFHGIGAGLSYSYHPDTVICVKINNEVNYLTMKDLFDKFKLNVENKFDYEEIDLSNMKNADIVVLDENQKYTKITRVLRHKTDKKLLKIQTLNGFGTIVTENHPVILEDGSEINAGDLKINNKIKISNSKLTLTENIDLNLEFNINDKLPENILNWNTKSILYYINSIITKYSEKVNENYIITFNDFSTIQKIKEILNIFNVDAKFKFNDNDYSLIINSLKLDNLLSGTNIDECELNEQISNEISLIEEYKNECEYVYDITTESGQFHSQGLIQHNCFNYSTYDIMMKGLPMVKKIKCDPPKHLYAFKSQLEQFTIIAANSTLGATGLADMLVVMSYYVKNILTTLTDAHFTFKDEESAWRYVKENLVSFIYTINQPMRGNQSCFTNISIYDDVFLESLKDDYLFPDGTTMDVELVKQLQDLFLTIMNDEMARTTITFPVTTACFSKDENNQILDKNFLPFIAKHNKKWGFINIYVGSSSTLSSCCFDGSQQTLTKSSDGVNFMTFKELYESPYENTKRNFTIFHNGSWVKGKCVKIKKDNKKLYKIITSNKKEFILTEDHINVTLNNEKPTNTLTNNDYLLFNTLSLNSFPEKNMNLTYSNGILIGAYLGDGSMYTRKNSNSTTITFSINEDKKEKLENHINKCLNTLNINDNININYDNETKLVSLSISSIDLSNFIKNWVSGKYANEKELNMNCLLQNKEFRQGIIDGYYITDGGNSNRIYSTSKNLIYQIEAVLTSLGLNSIIDMIDRTDEKVVIRDVEYNRNFPTYSIRWYDMKNKRSMEDIYKIKNNSVYFKINSIEEYISSDEYVYCFEMKNSDEPYFTLPNGLITHNCRLRSDKTNEYFNSFGSGSSKIGSLGVVTLNLPRLAIKYKKDKFKFYNELKNLVNVASKINNAKRKLVQKRVDTGNHPLYSLGFMDIDKQYSTVGINGFNECIQILGENILTEEGTEIGLKIIDTINEENDRCAKYYKTAHNTEQIPAETVSVKIAAKDRLLKYQNEYQLYSNQFIPLVTNANMLDRIRLQGVFDSHFSGGAIAHINVDTEIEDEKQIENLIELCANKGVVYFAINYVLSKCKNGHLSVSNDNICPICGEEITDKYTRVVGFLTAVKNWNKTRRDLDFPNRQFYKGSDI